MRTVCRHGAVSVLVLGLAVPPALAEERTVETEHHRLRVETMAEGLDHPWGLALLPDGRFLVTERNPGHLRLGSRHGELSGPVEGVPGIFRYKGETGRSQGGLFDVVLHPEFDENNFVYLSFSKPTERGAGVAIVRGRLSEDGDTPRLEDVETIFEMKEEDQDSSGLHFGGRMAFHPEDHTLFLSIGERRNISRAQDPDDQAGSIIRITDDGSVPENNPFVGDDGKDDKIFSWGHRNPQGLAFNPETNELWSNEHGPKGGDEINRIEAGNNYGWPFVTGGVDYSGAPLGVGTEKEGMTSAVHIFDDTVSPSGLAFYTGELFSEWRGDMLNGGLVSEGILRVRVSDGEVVEEEHIDLGRRIRDVKIAGDGAIWVITEYEDGEVLRLTPAEEG
jgi:aldose sugar dehydrogenase